MSDLIDRELLIEQIKEDSYGNEGSYGDMWRFMDTINKMPSVQSERCEDCKNFSKTRLLIPQPEIIRCKDCKWFNKPGCSIQIVDDSDKPSENDYCSFAELRGDSDDN